MHKSKYGGRDHRRAVRYRRRLKKGLLRLGVKQNIKPLSLSVTLPDWRLLNQTIMLTREAFKGFTMAIGSLLEPLKESLSNLHNSKDSEL